MSITSANPTGMQGISFVEFASPNPQYMQDVFRHLGFSKVRQHKDQDVSYYEQNDIIFLLNQQDDSFGAQFANDHGPSICAMGWLVDNPEQAFAHAVAKGAKPYTDTEKKTLSVPAIYGIGDSLIYFIQSNDVVKQAFLPLEQPELVDHKGFLCIDHLTNNVYKGTMETWSNFYKDIFGFTEVRTFDIRGQKTGLQSYALRSPDGSFCIPINEGTEEKSQIEEYLRDYKGPGIQHLALLSNDLLASLDQLEGSGIKTLDIHPDYYEEAFQRVPQVTEDRSVIRKHQVLVDGDPEGYLLQIFTENLFGPIFFELIQRKNHLSFGEGNFQALFESIERDQERRGAI